jgi:alpha-1,6-mannosyltransferase
MRVCDVVQFHSPISGGVKRYIGDKIRAFADRPEVAHSVILPGRTNAVRTEGRSRIHEIASPPLLGSRSYRLLLNRSRLLAVLAAERPDVIEVDAPYLSAWDALAGGRRLGARVVAFYHSDYPRALARTLAKCGLPASRWLERQLDRYVMGLLNRMDATLVASSLFCEELRRIGVRRIRHVPLGVDPAVFHPRPSRDRVRAQFGVPAGAPLLVFAGRLAREKHPCEVVAMMDRLRGPGTPPHLVLVGDGELRRRVLRMAARRPNIRWLGHCEEPGRLAELYSAADLLVHAGTADTFGLVSLEAQACGARVVAVKGGGLADTLDLEPTPVTARDCTPEALAEAVRRALALGDHEAARRARSWRVSVRFPVQAMVDRLLAVYRESLQSPVASATAAERTTRVGLPHPALCAG